MAFGGKAWSIKAEDMNLGPVSSGSTTCVGAIINVGAPTGGGAPDWVVGGTFLKNVYSVFRYKPPTIGFAELSDAAM